MHTEDDIGQRVRRAIKRAGWTQQAMAKALGVEPTSLSRYLAGSRPLKWPVLVEIAGLLGLTMEELTGNPATEGKTGAERFMDLIELGAPPLVAWELVTGQSRSVLPEAEREQLAAMDPGKRGERELPALPPAPAPDRPRASRSRAGKRVQ
jgi:transcriptional regulator with XRE-family HTH domain